ncbi:MAG: peptidoglycan editing factor PgeF [Burkholderiaceae bacterium]
MKPDARWIVPDWPAPRGVRALITTRAGGVSCGPWGVPPEGSGGMNLGPGSGDDPAAIAANRARLRELLPEEPRWLRQEHGARVVDAESVVAPPAADASTALAQNVVCAVLVADCVPVLLADARGHAVAAAHAGWRGLAAGVLQATVRALRARLRDPTAELLAYLGPAIGPEAFEVGADVLDAMRDTLPQASAAFRAIGGGKYLADLFALARQALAQAGVDAVYGGIDSTYADPPRFYSYRRDRVTGRHAALVWRASD